MPTPTETWQDRRGMFQRGKDVHQPGRKLSNQFGDPLAGRRTSIGSTGSVGLEKTDSIEEPGAQRRRSSAANRGLFENLNTHKRGSQDYTERRASYTEMAGNSPGLVSGWFNKTFKGMEKPVTNTATMGNDGKMMSAEQKRVEERRGVME